MTSSFLASSLHSRGEIQGAWIGFRAVWSGVRAPNAFTVPGHRGSDADRASRIAGLGDQESRERPRRPTRLRGDDRIGQVLVEVARLQQAERREVLEQDVEVVGVLGLQVRIARYLPPNSTDPALPPA